VSGPVRLAWSRADGSRQSLRSLRRAALHDALAEIDGGIAEGVAHDALGRPFCPDSPEICVSATARGTWGAAAAARDLPIGVDVESVALVPEWREIGALVFHPRIGELLARSAPGPRPERFARAWARMEACAKAAGTGIRPWHRGRDEPYRVTDIAAPNGYVAALAIDERPNAGRYAR